MFVVNYSPKDRDIALAIVEKLNNEDKALGLYIGPGTNEYKEAIHSTSKSRLREGIIQQCVNAYSTSSEWRKKLNGMKLILRRWAV